MDLDPTNAPKFLISDADFYFLEPFEAIHRSLDMRIAELTTLMFAKSDESICLKKGELVAKRKFAPNWGNWTVVWVVNALSGANTNSMIHSIGELKVRIRKDLSEAGKILHRTKYETSHDDKRAKLIHKITLLQQQILDAEKQIRERASKENLQDQANLESAIADLVTVSIQPLEHLQAIHSRGSLQRIETQVLAQASHLFGDATLRAEAVLRDMVVESYNNPTYHRCLLEKNNLLLEIQELHQSLRTFLLQTKINNKGIKPEHFEQVYAFAKLIFGIAYHLQKYNFSDQALIKGIFHDVHELFSLNMKDGNWDSQLEEMRRFIPVFMEFKSYLVASSLRQQRMIKILSWKNLEGALVKAKCKLKDIDLKVIGKTLQYLGELTAVEKKLLHDLAEISSNEVSTLLAEGKQPQDEDDVEQHEAKCLSHVMSMMNTLEKIIEGGHLEKIIPIASELSLLSPHLLRITSHIEQAKKAKNKDIQSMFAPLISDVCGQDAVTIFPAILGGINGEGFQFPTRVQLILIDLFKHLSKCDIPKSNLLKVQELLLRVDYLVFRMNAIQNAT